MSSDRRISEIFVELADTLVDDFDALDLMHTLAERSVELLHADAAGLILTDQRGDLQVVASTTAATRVLELLELQRSEGPCVDCFDSGQPVVNIEPAEARQRWPRFSAAANEAGYLSVHAVPLRLRREVLGAMNLYCAHDATLSPEDIALGQALADVATIGLLQERAVREHAVLVEQLQTALNGRIILEQAKGMLAERAEIDIDEAFTLMRAYSRDNQTRLVIIAEQVIADDLTPAELRGSAVRPSPGT